MVFEKVRCVAFCMASCCGNGYTNIDVTGHKKNKVPTSCLRVSSIEDYGKLKQSDVFIYLFLLINKKVNMLWLRPKLHWAITLLLIMVVVKDTCPGPVLKMFPLNAK